MTTEPDVLLGDAHPTIRIVPPGEGPYPGRLVAGDDEPCIAVRVEALDDWDGWGQGDASHLTVPLELIRTVDGHEVLLPWCRESLDVFLRRRESGPARLAPGECTTLLASVLRGVVEAIDPGLSGAWWLTASARPVFVIGEGETITGSAIAIVRRIAEHSADRGCERLCARIVEILGDPRRIPREAADAEEALCAWAAPKPLRQVSPGAGEDSGGTGDRILSEMRRSCAGSDSAARAIRAVRSRGEGASDGHRRSSDPARSDVATARRVQRQRRRPSNEEIRVAWQEARRRLSGIRRLWQGEERDHARRPAKVMTRRWTKPLAVGAGVAAVLAIGGVLWPSGAQGGAGVAAEESVAAQGGE